VYCSVVWPSKPHELNSPVAVHSRECNPACFLILGFQDLSVLISGVLQTLPVGLPVLRLLSGPKKGNIAPINVIFGTRCQISCSSGQKHGNTAPKTVKIRKDEKVWCFF